MFKHIRNLFKPKPTWQDFLDRHPVEWGRLLDRLSDGAPDFSKKDLENREALTLAAVTEVASADAAEFIKQFTHFHPAQFLPENRDRFPIVGKIEALSPVQRTEYFVDVLRGLKLLRATSGMAVGKVGMAAVAWPKETSDDAMEANLKFFDMDVTKYPRFLNAGSSGVFNVTSVSYAAAEIAKGKLVVEEDLATEFLKLVRSRPGDRLCFAKGLAKHLVSPYRNSPSREYLGEFHETQAVLNDNWKSFGRQNAWAEFKHYLRKLMNNANAP